uniref:Lipocalin/cytosolic fatty-acid binding domain-containing protein n=1 Tax=Strigamia maritima TaxID=126957 RepID=T1JPG0_STRMM
MSGLWYVIQKTKSAGTCMTLDFRNNDGKLTVAESCLPLGISVPNVMEKFTQIGKLKVPDQNNPAKMTVAYPFSLIPFTEVDFWIVDTDYTTFAAIWSCRPLLVANRRSAMILSRNAILDQEIVHKLRNKFQSYKINKNALSIVKQKGCGRSEVLDPKDLDPENNNPPQLTVTTTERETTTHTQTHVLTETLSPKTQTITQDPETHTITQDPETQHNSRP